MTTANVDIPRRVADAVHSYDREDTDELRRRLDDVENSNLALMYQMAQLQAGYEEMQAKYAELAAAVEYIRGAKPVTAISPAPGPSRLTGSCQCPYEDKPRGILALCDEFTSRHFVTMIPKHLRKNVVVANDETYWPEFPNLGISVKPDRRLSKRGVWQESKRQLLRRFQEVELVTRTEGSWYYLGTYAVAMSDTLLEEGIGALPDKTRAAVIAQSGHKSHRTRLQAMFEAGEISATEFTLTRVAYSDALEALLLQALREMQQLPAGSAASDGSDYDAE